MSEHYIEDQLFQNRDFREAPLQTGTYVGCRFEQCIFTGTDLSGVEFEESNFTDCDLSNAKLTGTAFRDTNFQDSKLLGLHFEDCSQFLFTPRFTNCQLQHASFFGCRLKNFVFQNCNLKEADLTNADCSNAVFGNCNLESTTFDGTDLEGADLRTALHFTIDPVQNKVRKARFSVHGLPGLLARYGIRVEE